MKMLLTCLEIWISWPEAFFQYVRICRCKTSNSKYRFEKKSMDLHPIWPNPYDLKIWRVLPFEAEHGSASMPVKTLARCLSSASQKINISFLFLKHVPLWAAQPLEAGFYCTAVIKAQPGLLWYISYQLSGCNVIVSMTWICQSVAIFRLNTAAILSCFIATRCQRPPFRHLDHSS